MNVSANRTIRRHAALLASVAVLGATVLAAPAASAHGSVAVSIGLPGLAVGYSSRGVGFVAAAPYAPGYYAPAYAPAYATPYAPPVVSYSAPYYPAPYYGAAPAYYPAPVAYAAPVVVPRVYYGGYHRPYPYYRPYYRSAHVVYHGHY